MSKKNKRRTLSNEEKAKKDTAALKAKEEFFSRDPYTFDPIEDWIWREYESSTSIDIDNFIDMNKNCAFFIGTDSQNYPKSRKCVFTSVLIAYTKGRGGAIARHTDKRPMIPIEALSARLTTETQRSIELCKYLENRLFDLSFEDELDDKDYYNNNIVGISIDVNNDSKYKSGRYKDMLVGMVIGQGYEALVKPDSWAASSVADNRC
jgi:predicted RNase H-related nuclease YkuK (DUF458 family)